MGRWDGSWGEGARPRMAGDPRELGGGVERILSQSLGMEPALRHLEFGRVASGCEGMSSCCFELLSRWYVLWQPWQTHTHLENHHKLNEAAPSSQFPTHLPAPPAVQAAQPRGGECSRNPRARPAQQGNRVLTGGPLGPGNPVGPWGPLGPWGQRMASLRTDAPSQCVGPAAPTRLFLRCWFSGQFPLPGPLLHLSRPLPPRITSVEKGAHRGAKEASTGPIPAATS